MLANHSWLHSMAEWLPFIALVVVGSGYLFGSWRRGISDTWKETVDAQATELAAIKVTNLRITDEANSLKSDVAKLEGIVAQLRNENTELRKLVMLDKVPPALIEYMSASSQTILAEVHNLHAKQTEDLKTEIEELLHPVAQGVARLLTEGPR